MKKPQLFLLHFAGGNCYSFQFIVSFLKDFETVSLELPGRGKRINEGLVKDFDLAARDIYNQVMKRLTSSFFLIYGHSLGAYLALRVCNMLQRAGKSPAYLIVSGNAGPGMREKKNVHLLEREYFIKELLRLGGVSPELIANNEVFDFIEPILRADFEVAESNEMNDEPAVSSPLYALMGSSEEKVKDISNWARFTLSDFTAEILEGDHFFIFRHPQRIAAIIKECYDKVVLVQRR
jgi:external thioesterase TEII